VLLPGHYVKRPKIVAAIRYLPDIPNCHEVLQFIGATYLCNRMKSHDDPLSVVGIIAQPGDWIIGDVNSAGELEGPISVMPDAVFNHEFSPYAWEPTIPPYVKKPS
jgi:hypothetical protein